MKTNVSFFFSLLMLITCLQANASERKTNFEADVSFGTLTLSTTVSDISSQGANDGSIIVTVLSGTPPYTYAWSHNASLNTNTATGLATGDYFVLVTDATGCTGVASERILDPLECDGSFFHIIKDAVNIEMDIYLASITSAGMISSSLVPIGYQAQALDAFGYNQSDNFVYAIGRQNQHLIKIGAGAVSKDLGPLTGINSSLTYTGGVCNGNTFYFYGSGSPGALYSVDLTTLSVTTVSSAIALGKDLGYLQISSDEYIVSVRAAKIALYNLTNPAASGIYPIVQMTPDPMSANNEYTALWVDDDQSIFVYNSSNGLTHRLVAINNRYFAVDLGTLSYAIPLTDGLNCLDGQAAVSCDLSITADVTACDSGNGNGAVDIDPIGAQGIVSYYWTDGGNGEVRTNLAAGPYTVYAFDELGCYDTLSFVIPSCSPYQIATNQSHQTSHTISAGIEVNTFPNPFTDAFTLELTLPQAMEAELWITDTLGQPISQLGQMTFGEGKHQTSIDLSAYASGVYFYRLESKGIIRIGRLLKL